MAELEKTSYFSDNVKNKFLKRPLISKYTFPEKIGINPMPSTFPLPQVLSRYEKVCVNIFYHTSITNFQEEEEEFYKNYKNEPSNKVEPIVYEKNIGLFYVIDTLIKDALIFLRKNLNNRVKDLDESGIEINNEINEKRPDYVKKFDEMINDPKNKFLLKIALVEEHLFGDSPISSNSHIRRKIREREKVTLLLLRKTENELKPNLSNFPLIIRVGEKREYSYDILFQSFFKKINQKSEIEAEKSIIFMFKNGITNKENNENPSKNPKEIKEEDSPQKIENNNNEDNLLENIFNENNNNNNIEDKFEKNNFEFYQKKNLKRREYLKKYCESGEADYPFTVKVKSINNLTAILYHIIDKEYNFSDQIIMNFKKKVMNKKNFLENLRERFNFCKKKNEEDKDKESEKERKHQEKLMKTRESNYKEEKELINKLNFMNFNKNKHLEDITINTRHKLHSFRHINFTLKDYYKTFSLKNNEETNYGEFKPEEKRNFYNHKEETYKNPFNMIINYLNFLPVHIVLEVSLAYGMSSIRMFKTKCAIIKEDIIINEKINFSQIKEKHSSKEDQMDYKFLYVIKIMKNLKNS